jgi:hypothetical protein
MQVLRFGAQRALQYGHAQHRPDKQLIRIADVLSQVRFRGDSRACVSSSLTGITKKIGFSLLCKKRISSAPHRVEDAVL